MLDAGGTILYVGKAGNLKARVASYFRADLVQPKVLAMVQQIAAIEVTVTHSDTEALLLEFNLIKKHRPRYNILLKDDKSFPYLYLTTQQRVPAPQLLPRAAQARRALLRAVSEHGRGARDAAAAAEAVPAAAVRGQLLRQSHAAVPAVPDPALLGAVRRADLGAATTPPTSRAPSRVLEGRNDEVAVELARRMEEEAAALRFEKAAALRDQLAALKSVQARQIVTAAADVDCDVVAAASGPGLYCIGLMFIRGGINLGTTTYFAKAPFGEPEEVEAAFLAQHYLAHDAPAEIVVGGEIADREVLAAALGERAGHRVQIHRAERGLKARFVEMTRDNAVQALKMRLATEAGIEQQLAGLGTVLGLAAPPARLECFDISHTRGEATVASCVVFGREGAQKADYRRFNLEGLTPGDDYGAMRAALARRYRRIKAGEAKVPDVLLIDGGPGQLAEAGRVLAELEVAVPAVVGVAKGPDRRVGQERLFLLGSDSPLILPPDSRALHLIQRIRDEAHRFAIAGHRARRAKARQASVLEEVPGLGPARRRELLKRFGGLHGVLGAGVEDLARVRGIGRRLAEAIYERLHPDA